MKQRRHRVIRDAHEFVGAVTVAQKHIDIAWRALRDLPLGLVKSDVQEIITDAIQSLDMAGMRLPDVKLKLIPICPVCASRLTSENVCANCLVADEQSDYSNGQRLCDAQDDHFMQHYCPEYDGPEE